MAHVAVCVGHVAACVRHTAAWFDPLLSSLWTIYDGHRLGTTPPSANAIRPWRTAVAYEFCHGIVALGLLLPTIAATGFVVPWLVSKSACMHAYRNACTHVYTHACTPAYTDVCTHACLYECPCTCQDLYRHLCMPPHMSMHSYCIEEDRCGGGLSTLLDCEVLARYMCVDTCAAMCVDMCAAMCAAMCIDACADMCVDMCAAMCAAMCVDACAGMCVQRYA